MPNYHNKLYQVGKQFYSTGQATIQLFRYACSRQNPFGGEYPSAVQGDDKNKADDSPQAEGGARRGRVAKLGAFAPWWSYSSIREQKHMEKTPTLHGRRDYGNREKALSMPSPNVDLRG